MLMHGEIKAPTAELNTSSTLKNWYLQIRLITTVQREDMVAIHHIHVRNKMAPAGNECYNVFLFVRWCLHLICMNFIFWTSVRLLFRSYPWSRSNGAIKAKVALLQEF